MTVMRFTGWSWNLLNLMGLPLILGTGVDYSIFMQLALRRHHGDLKIAHRSVGRALLLCGATAISGFGMLGLSSNAGMASFGQVCAIGIASNMLISVFLLPVWWRTLVSRWAKSGGDDSGNNSPSTPSSLYGIRLWKLGLAFSRVMPIGVCYWLADRAADVYWLIAKHRREVVIQNLMPVLNDDRAVARQKAKQLFRNFTRKLIDLWRYEDGKPIDKLLGKSFGWENFEKAQAQKRGVLLLTLHLGNWEFGAPWLAQRGTTLHVVTLTEPSAEFTEFRKAARARWNVETLVVGNDPFAFVEIIHRLEAGATIALLIDRPTRNSSAQVELFGRPFDASVAAVELARASGCTLLPVYLPREDGSYAGHILPAVDYDRATLRDREARRKLLQEIMRAFEPAIRQHPDQWFHFVPVWPNE
ncbi:MAG TPA: MMPL family transporter, partial [Verrucomicrobiae bacterium]|nr:MMPL family transporter [Verrucomicrobiae bacterium]